MEGIILGAVEIEGKLRYRKQCCVCEKIYVVFPYRQDSKYCSIECSRKDWKPKPRKGRVLETCSVCETEFTTWNCKQKHGNGKFCSKECFNSQIPSRSIDFKVDENGCFIVTSHAPYSTGYFVTVVNGRRKSIHRLVYEECFGEIPKGLVVRHKCDVRGCVNPEHLEIGTQRDNVMDTVKRNRTLKGVLNPNCKITEEDSFLIKKMISLGAKSSRIALELNVSKSIVANIRSGSAWKHIVL